MALSRIEREYNAEDFADPEVSMYLLDLIANRDVSNAVAAEFEVMHQSPQVMVIKQGQSVYDESHMGINFRDVARQAQ